MSKQKESNRISSKHCWQSNMATSSNCRIRLMFMKKLCSEPPSTSITLPKAFLEDFLKEDPVHFEKEHQRISSQADKEYNVNVYVKQYS